MVRLSEDLQKCISFCVSVLLLAGFVWLMLPIYKALNYTSPQVYLSSLDVSIQQPNFARFWPGFNVSNPKGWPVDFTFNLSTAVVYYDGANGKPLATAMVESFELDDRTNKYIKVNVDALSMEVEPWVEQRMVSSAAGGGTLIFNVKFSSSVDPFPGRSYCAEYYCRGVEVGFSGNGSAGHMIGGSKKCKVKES